MRALPGVVGAYNTAQQKSTGFTPFYLMFGRQAKLFIELESNSSGSSQLDNPLPDILNDVNEDQFQQIMKSNNKVADIVYKALDSSAAEKAAKQKRDLERQ